MNADHIDLIGASFIVLQTKIRRVSSRAVSLNQELKRFGLVITGFDAQPAVLALGDIYKGTGSTLVQLIWDVGNYFKHRDEWPSEVWDEDDAQTIKARWKTAWRTRKSVARAGIERSSTGNMRTAFEFFDVEPYSRCALLAEKVQEWAD